MVKMLLVLIGEDRLEGTPMQVQGNDISRGKRALWQGSEEQFVDHFVVRDANRTGGGSRRMGCDDHPTPSSRRSERNIGAIEERAAGSRFRVRGLLIRLQGQAGLHLGQIEEIVVLASHYVAKPFAGEALHDGIVAILPIQAYYPLSKGNLLGGQIGTDRLRRLEEIPSVITIARAREGAQPLMRMCLENGGASSDDFAAFAAQISGSTDLIEAPLSYRKIGCTW